MEKTTGPRAMARLDNPVIKINAYKLTVTLIVTVPHWYYEHLITEPRLDQVRSISTSAAAVLALFFAGGGTYFFFFF
jgi:hypothetical protein